MNEIQKLRDHIVLKVQRMRKRLERLEETAPQNPAMHLKAIQLDAQIFALENILMEI